MFFNCNKSKSYTSEGDLENLFTFNNLLTELRAVVCQDVVAMRREAITFS